MLRTGPRAPAISITKLKGHQSSMKILPLTSVSACSSWLVIAQGGGGALLLVLLNVDSADPYKQTMTLLEDIVFFFERH